MPVIDYIPRRDGSSQEIYPAKILLRGYLGFPLERAVRFRNKTGSGDRNAHTAALVFCILPPAVQNPVRHFRNPDDVLIRLRRQAEHIIELDAVPAAFKSNAAGIQQIFFRYILVDGIAQALAAAFHSEGQPAFPDALQPVHQFHGKVVRSERRKRNTDASLLTVFEQAVTDLLQLPVVTGGKREKRQFLITGILQGFDSLPDQRLRLF